MGVINFKTNQISLVKVLFDEKAIEDIKNISTDSKEIKEYKDG